jgi:hypothetical protein
MARIERFENLVEELDSMLNCGFANLVRQKLFAASQHGA